MKLRQYLAMPFFAIYWAAIIALIYTSDLSEEEEYARNLRENK